MFFSFQCKKLNRPANDEFEIIAGPGHGILGLFMTQLENVRRVDSDQRISNAKPSLFSQTATIHLKVLKK
jgi:hypothetical protein